MKKAVVIGGSNGVGLAITNKLISKDYHVDILDRSAPEQGVLPSESFVYHYCDLLDMDEDLISSFAEDSSISMLIITAGFGRVADFEYFHISEIRNMMTVNATSTISILRLFYDRIKGKEKFCCGVMGSISGLMSSPMTAVYSASKAAVCRFIESVNIELEVSGTSNRILNVSPASFKGSRFNGGKNQLDLLDGLAEEIIEHTINADCLFIPQYEETFKAVLERYHNDPHEYGLHSYEYKKASNRALNEKRTVVGYLSGAFDLFDHGQLSLIRSAKQKCDYLIVGVREKAENVPFEERKDMVSACKYVDKVIDASNDYSTVCKKYGIDCIFEPSDDIENESLKACADSIKNSGVKIVSIPNTRS